jgi:hypothetical protein
MKQPPPTDNRIKKLRREVTAQVDEGNMTRGFFERSRTEFAEYMRHTGYNGPPASVNRPRATGRATALSSCWG